VTGAAGDVGAIGRTVTQLLLEAGLPVRAMVRREDERAEALRAMGAEVVVGDLLDLNAMHRAIEGCSRLYFGMSVSPAYLEATVNTAAVALHHGVEAFINMSQMTVTQMSITETTPSPQHKLHWLSEQALAWSGLPVVTVRPTVFLEGFFLRFAASGVKRNDELALPMGLGKTSPISAFDVARAVAEILKKPAPHIGRIFNLAGPQSADLEFYAREFSEVLGRRITYRDIPLGAWRQKLEGFKLPAHLIDHVTAMAALSQQNRYDRTSGDMQLLTGSEAMTMREFVAKHAASFTASGE
jgi:uncharacterized protein YbjT (DUF2867 family)